VSWKRPAAGPRRPATARRLVCVRHAACRADAPAALFGRLGRSCAARGAEALLEQAHRRASSARATATAAPRVQLCSRGAGAQRERRAARNSSAASGAQPGRHWPCRRCASTRAAQRSERRARSPRTNGAGRPVHTRARRRNTARAATGSRRARLNLNGAARPTVPTWRQVDARQAGRTAST
jgi:hypothetical protein